MHRAAPIPLPGRLVILGTGSIAQGFLPLLARHAALDSARVTLLGPDPVGFELARRSGVRFLQVAVTRDNFAAVLAPLLECGDCLLNLALEVGSLDLLAWCQARDVLYLDTNLEPWPGAPHLVHEARARALALRRPDSATAVLAHGANPGLVSHFLKEALCELSPSGLDQRTADWGARLRALGVSVVVIAECDTQRGADTLMDGEFVNTWSARGLFGELCSPAELNWGSHEGPLPTGAAGHARAAVLPGPAARWRVCAWTPAGGEFTGFLLAHHETHSLGALLGASAGAAQPSVFYAYQPCPDAQDATARLPAQPRAPSAMHVLREELVEGGNALGVLLLGEDAGYWYGSQLDLAAARALVPHNNATTLQVAAGVLGALVWAWENPRAGIVEAENMDHRRILEIAAPYLGRLGGEATAWRPAPQTKGAAGLRFECFFR